MENQHRRLGLRLGLFESGCSPKKIKISPIKKEKKNAKFRFNLLPLLKFWTLIRTLTIIMRSQTPTRKQSPLRSSQAANISPKQKTAAEYLNDLNESPLAELEALYRIDLDKKYLYVPAGRGQGPHKKRNYARQPPVKVDKDRTVTAYPFFLLQEGPFHNPLPAVVATTAQELEEVGAKGTLSISKLLPN